MKNISLQDSIRTFRLHNQGQPNVTSYYKSASYSNEEALYTLPKKDDIEKLEDVGHIIGPTTDFSVTQAIIVGDKLHAMSDSRKSAEADGYNCITYNSTHSRNQQI